MDCFAAGSQPLFFDQHITAVRPSRERLDNCDAITPNNRSWQNS